jgi:hypothetical protein
MKICDFFACCETKLAICLFFYFLNRRQSQSRSVKKCVGLNSARTHPNLTHFSKQEVVFLNHTSLSLSLSACFDALTHPKLTNSITIATFFTPTYYPRCQKEQKVSKVFLPNPNNARPQTPNTYNTNNPTTLHTLQKDPNHPPTKPERDPIINFLNTLSHYGASGC